MDIQISVLTLVKGRKTALLNLINGLSHNHNKGIELVIIHMNEEIDIVPDCTFPIRSSSCFSKEKLPLAKARNLAIAQAASEFCVFLDVDCIPASNFIDQYLAAFKMENKLWSGLVRYLKPGFTVDANCKVMDQWSTADPIRDNLDTLPYELFWSLNFGCTKTVFTKIGGFDESYTGYGAEDTDFSFMARSQGIELAVVKAMAYHQPHDSYDPPLNHLLDVVNNANVFYQKWQRWPMEGWLRKFAELGYVIWRADALILVDSPLPSAIEKCRK